MVDGGDKKKGHYGMLELLVLGSYINDDWSFYPPRTTHTPTLSLSLLSLSSSFFFLPIDQEAWEAAMEEDPSKEEDQCESCKTHVVRVLEALKQASHDLQSNPSSKSSSSSSSSSDSSAINALLELEIESESILSTDPYLSTLSTHLSNLKSLVETLHKARGSHFSLKSFLARKVSSHSISRLAGSIEDEIQAWIDRESVEKLSGALQEKPIFDEERLIKLLTQFENRVSQGFNRELQDLILKSKVFLLLESVLCDGKCSKRVREHSAFAIAALIRFNKDVFVGQVFLGTTVQALITMSSPYSIKVLCGLIQTIKSPLVDEINSNDEIPKIISFLSSENLDIQLAAMDCVLEIGYFGRREAIEAVIKEGLVEKLVELQRSELGGDLIDMGRFEDEDDGERNRGVCAGGVGEKQRSKQRRYMENHPFASCVARFAVQLEVGEGLRQRERSTFKQGILVRVRKAAVCDAELATIVAEVLWGSSP